MSSQLARGSAASAWASSAAILRTTTAGLTLADALVHAAVLPEHFKKALYMGILFAFALLFLGMLAIGLAKPPLEGNALLGLLTKVSGILLMAGLLAGYFVTRTIGLPGFHGGWDPLSLTAVAMEALIVVLLLADLALSRVAGSTD